MTFEVQVLNLDSILSCWFDLQSVYWTEKLISALIQKCGCSVSTQYAFILNRSIILIRKACLYKILLYRVAA